jgi:hypothetical protein
MSETELVSAVIKTLQQAGHMVWRNNTGAAKMASGRYVRFGMKGASDILGIQKGTGKLLALECKVGDKYGATKEQQNFLLMVKQHKGS